ncbi:hypothetical protein C5S39_14725 [Candidatus Methanophagaceae archaeon]|nr:hypothetical protein C5S39_14725 [Methanophagales archaeon]
MRERERRFRGRLRGGVENARMAKKGITKMILSLLNFILAGRRRESEKL